MGLITKEVEIRFTGKDIKHYEEKGYTIPMKRASEKSIKKYKKIMVYDFSKTLIVKVEDLPPCSAVNIECQCDYCGCLYQTKYEDYRIKVLDGIIHKCACKNCRYLKASESNMITYGVDSPFKIEGVQDKIRTTITERYGKPNYLQTEEGKKRVANTNLERYGSICPLNNKEIKQKAINSTIEKYGVVNPFQSSIIKEQIRQSFIDKYGVDNPMRIDEVKQKVVNTYAERYKDNDPRHSEEAQSKRVQTLYQNNTTPSSRQQRYIANLYKMGLNYPLKYWNVDMFDQDDNLYAEFDGSGHALSVQLNNISQEEFDKKETKRFYSLKQSGYKMMRIISSHDKLPSDEILLQMLSDAKQYFKDYPEHSWINFDIDNNTVKNAEYERSYFYGNLRKITKNDLVSA